MPLGWASNQTNRPHNFPLNQIVVLALLVVTDFNSAQEASFEVPPKGLVFHEAVSSWAEHSQGEPGGSRRCQDIPCCLEKRHGLATSRSIQ
jgi:hypothetical protein